MAEATPNKAFVQTDFGPGWVLQRGTAAKQNSLILLDNAEIQPDNTIRSRSGTIKINEQTLTDGSSTNVHSLYLQGPSTRYIGVGALVKRGIDPGTNIITGLNGSPLTFASAAPSTAVNNPFVYFGNGEVAARRKDNGTVTRLWGVDGPSVAPTVSLSANQPATVAIDSMDSAYTVVGAAGSEAAATNPYSGGARAFSVTAAGSAQFRRAVSVDLSGLKDQAFIRFMARVDTKTNLDRLELAFDVSGGATFASDFYYVIVGNSLITKEGDFVEVLVRKSDFFRTKPSGSSTKTWADVSAVQFTLAATSRGAVTLSVDDLRMEASTHPNGGPFEYVITFWSDESKIQSNPRSLSDSYNPTPTFRISNQIMAHKQRVVIDRTAVVTSDPQVSHWQWHRRDLNVSEVFQFGERLPIAQLTANDDFGTEDLGEALVEEHHVPPAGRFVISHDDRVWVAGMSNLTTNSGVEESSYVLRYSLRFYPDSFPFTQYVQVSDPTDPIHGMCVYSSRLFVFTRKFIYEIVSTGGSYIAQRTESPYGCDSPYSIAAFPGGILFFSSEGVAVFDGITARLLSDESLRPFFRREVTQHFDGFELPRLAATTIAEYETAVGAYFGNRYWLTVTQTDGERVTLVMDLTGPRWARFKGREGWKIARLQWQRSEVTPVMDRLEAGTSDGELIRLFTTNPESLQDGGCAPVEIAIQTTFADELKLADSPADFRDIVVDCDTAGQSLLTEASFSDSALTIIGVQRSTQRSLLYFPINQGQGQIAQKISIRLSMAQATGHLNVYGIGVRYWPEPRPSLSFESQFHFATKAGWARRLRLTARSLAPITGQLLMDGQERHRFVLPATGGQRQGLNISMPAGARGKVAELRLNSDKPFSLYPTSYIEVSSLGVPEAMQPWALVT